MIDFASTERQNLRLGCVEVVDIEIQVGLKMVGVARPCGRNMVRGRAEKRSSRRLDW